MKYFSIPAAALLLATSVSPAISQPTGCSIGTWTPDYDALEARIRNQIDAPNAEFSGIVLMVIGMTNSAEELQFQIEDWSIQRKDSADDDTKFVLNGISLNSIAATSSGSFHISQQSNTYVQTSIEFGLESSERLFEWMLPVGEWASGKWSCVDDVIQFSVRDQDSDGHLVETWYRQ